MEENIIGRIAEAESQAAAIKARAQAEAAEILAAAEKTAAENLKSSEAECSELVKSGIKAAEVQAQSDYANSISSARMEAEKYADGLLENIESHVSEIVGRLTK